ncbi:phosphatidate cytidylyltransferase [Methylobacillus caricis]|uniref:phosphatidate cytidylyltransferase n=1 Tax=Methylobacillus caricis TaxID=1971611 RepID=UPI001CFF60BD|nr:phosphatidate cytidylyltransferase [Methylobacillus caricis]MCB5187436.1 phosphatidate cytidylyltransferase [Methylobacillus caricis]
MLKTRLLTAAILIPLFLAVLFLLPDPYWSLLMLVAAGAGLWEWSGMARFKLSVRYLYVAAAMVGGVFLTFWRGPENAFLQEYSIYWGLLSAVIFWVLLVPVWLATRAHIKNIYLMMLAGWLIVIPLWLALVSLRGISPWLLLGLMLAVWIADSAAYFAGKRFGKRKLAINISPGKTWEGVLGAWVVVSLYGLALCLSLDISFWLIVGFWGMTILSIMGDLLESLIKRQAGLKDSGSLLPGHGGILDRVDGLTSSLPLAAFFIYFPLYYQAWMHSA